MWMKYTVVSFWSAFLLTLQVVHAESLKLEPAPIEPVNEEVAKLQGAAEDFIQRALTNPAVTFEQPSGELHEFTPADLARAQQWLVQVLANATSGEVDVAALQKSAADIGLTTAELGALQSDLAASLTTTAMPIKDQQALLATLEAAQTDLLALQ